MFFFNFIINLHFTILDNFTYYLYNLRFDFAPKTSKQAEKSPKNKNNTSKSSKNADDDDDRIKQSARLSSSKMSRKKIVSELENEDEE